MSDADNPILSFLSKYLDLDNDERAEILGLDIVRGFSRGDIVAEQGEVSGRGYFVLSGLIRCHRKTDGADKTLDFYSEGEVFEPHDVHDGKPLEYSISCVEDSMLAIGTPALEREAMARFPRFEQVCRMVAEESAHKSRRALQDFKLLTPQERYANLCAARPDLIQRVPQYMIAGYLGIEPESLSRIRSRLARN